jgi:hypothetical protein
MSAPRRWVDDPDADEALRELLRGTTGARPLDQLTRRRLGAKVARTAALPAATAGWLFVKSAAAALGVVLGGGALAVSAGVVDWSPRERVESRPAARAPQSKPAIPVSRAPLPQPEPSPLVDEPETIVNPVPSLPAVSAAPVASAVGTLSAEAALLERARRQMRAAPELALAIAAEHSRRFARGQLASERALIQIEALHRLGRDAEARKLARGLPGLYGGRVERLLGPETGP